MQTRRSFLGFGCMALLASPALAKRGDWVLLGVRRINLLKERDLIYVGLNAGLFTGLKLQVAARGVFMESLSVRFVNNDKVDLPVRNFIEKGGETREILLPGLVRAIRAVDMRYRKIPTGGVAEVSVLARQA